jgi:pimeloyl-ACP methyl ester carboxylesterase
VIERRGRGASGPQGEDYAITRECEDLRAVQSATGAALVFGHSFGGLVALEAAIGDSGLRHVAVYEPGVSIHGSVRIGWAERCGSELDAGRPVDAFVTFVRGMSPQSAGRYPRLRARAEAPAPTRHDPRACRGGATRRDRRALPPDPRPDSADERTARKRDSPRNRGPRRGTPRSSNGIT